MQAQNTSLRIFQDDSYGGDSRRRQDCYRYGLQRHLVNKRPIVDIADSDSSSVRSRRYIHGCVGKFAWKARHCSEAVVR